MKTIVLSMVLLTGLFKCNQEPSAKDIPAECTTLVTVVDFTGKLDGCTIMLQLEDGSRLIPIQRTYIQAPKIEDDPLYYFQLKAGDKLKIAYREEPMGNVCMAGETVFLTCITKID